MRAAGRWKGGVRLLRPGIPTIRRVLLVQSVTVFLLICRYAVISEPNCSFASELNCFLAAEMGRTESRVSSQAEFF
jgi:hypothetical protein